jgi:superfamily II DNA or RNA helicase
MASLKEQIEVQAKALPSAPTPELLFQMRTEACAAKDFNLQSFQLFVRRILSPDSPNRNMLLFHGTGVGKTCTAIQVAEEYILRPEFQDKKVLVLSSPSVQQNFKTQIFDVTRVTDDHGLLRSQQCTGRRYLEMLERAQTENLRWENPESREKLKQIIGRMINDFYDFRGYGEFANEIDLQANTKTKKEFEEWIHKTFDGRLLIVDEAHNMRESPSVNVEKVNKKISEAIQKVVKIASGMTLVLLSATPMYDTFQEIMFLFNLFLWNDKRQSGDEKVETDSIFTKNGAFASPEKEATFRGYVHEYVSYVRGENPFTFPFRLPPPDDLLAKPDRTTDFQGNKIDTPIQYLKLTVSYLGSPQSEAVRKITGVLQEGALPTIVSGAGLEPSPNKQFAWRYKGEPYLSPSTVKAHATKFATVLNCITDNSGIIFIYSNYIQGGIREFAICLEEHGFDPAIGKRMIENKSDEYAGPSRGKYAMISSDLTPAERDRIVDRLRAQGNSKGGDIRIVLGSPLVSEGLDLKNIRQIHILDPWFNMSRIEQIVGRGLRTCSHKTLPPAEQNCTVYLHITRYPDDTVETYDEYMYREFVEYKAKNIAGVKRVLMQSAIDCTEQVATNQLPDLWKNLIVKQMRSQGGKEVDPPLTLIQMSAPTFEPPDTKPVECAPSEASGDDTPYVRPLSSYLDVRDQVFEKMIDLFKDKPIWKRDDLLHVFRYDPAVITYIVDNAIQERLKLKDSAGRTGTLERRGKMYAFAPEDIKDGTMFDRSVAASKRARTSVDIPDDEAPEEKEPVPRLAEEGVPELPEFKFPFDVSGFSAEIREWFIVDQMLSPEEKLRRVLQNPDKPYARGLQVEGTDLVVGPEGKVYDKEGTPVIPIAEQLDAFNAWKARKLDEIADKIKNQHKILCTLEDKVLKLSAFEVADGHIARIQRMKTVQPRACSSFKRPDIGVFARDVGGRDFPAFGSQNNQESRCIYLGLITRTETEKSFWVMPEVWATVDTKALRTKIV